MAIRYLLLYVFGALTICSQADVVTILRNENVMPSNSSSNEIKIRFMHQSCSVELSPSSSLLLDNRSGQVYHLFHPGKVYIQKPISELNSASPCGAITNPPQPFATGRSQTIGDLVAYEYLVTNPCGQHTLWVAPDYPKWKQIQSEFAKSGTNIPAGFQISSGSLPGMVVRTENIVKVSPQYQTTNSVGSTFVTNISTLISAVVVEDDPSLMRVPDDYREIKEFPTAESALTDQVTDSLVKEIEAQATKPHSQGSFATEGNGSFGGSLNAPSLAEITRANSANTNTPLAARKPPPLGTNQIRVIGWGAKGQEERIVTVENSTNSALRTFLDSARTNRSSGPRVIGQISRAPSITGTNNTLTTSTNAAGGTAH